MRSHSSPEMVGRTAQLQVLLEAFEEAASGSPRIVLVAGEAGIGKSRLLEEFAVLVAERARIVTGHCLDYGTVEVPYAPISEVLRDLVAQVGSEAVLDATTGGALADFLAAGTVGRDDHRIGIDRLNDAIATALERLSRERPLVAVIEDIHWADPATIDLVRFLARAAIGGAVMIVLTYRTEDVRRGHPLRGFLGELERSRRVERLMLDRLSRSEVREQAHAILGGTLSSDRLTALFRRSEGVPFFVEELLHVEGAGTVPETLRELLLNRYDGLGEDARAILRVLAAGGERVEHDLLVAVVDDPAGMERAIRDAVESGLLVATERDYAFRHALVRDAVREELLPGESTRFHTRYAETLAGGEGWAGDRAGRAARIAGHWFEAHDLGRAFPAALAAMESSLHAGAYATAGRLGERALDVWDLIPDARAIAGMTRRRLLEAVAESWYQAGDSTRALAMVDLALREDDAGEPARRARLLRLKARIRDQAGAPDSAGLYEEALELAGDDDPVARTGILAELAAQQMLVGRLEDGIERATEALAEAPEKASAFASVAANVRGCARLSLQDIEGGLSDLALAKSLAGGDLDALLRYYVNASDSYSLLGDYPTALDVASEGLALARANGVERSAGALLAVNTVDPLFALGRWDQADELVDHSLDLDPPTGFRTYLRSAKVRSLLWRGELDAAAQRYEGWRAGLHSFGAHQVQVRLGVAIVAGDLAYALGKLDDGWELAHPLLEQTRHASGWTLPLAATAARLLAARRRRAARAGTRNPLLTDDELAVRDAVARDAGWPTHGPWAALVAAELSGSTGTGDDPGSWRAVLDHPDLDRVPVVARMTARLGLARALAAAGERTEAAAIAAGLRDDAQALGAGLVSQWCDELIGLRTARAAAGDAELTAREQQVLDLITEGLSNGQIAARLFISPKTVSVHVSAILRKLGAESRTQAARLRLGGPSS